MIEYQKTVAKISVTVFFRSNSQYISSENKALQILTKKLSQLCLNTFVIFFLHELTK